MIFSKRICILLVLLAASLSAGYAEVCAVYFTGIGCPHCAKTDPVIFKDLLQKYPDLVVIEYEIYQQAENSGLLFEYNELYGTGLGIPLIIFDEENYIIGDTPILTQIENKLQSIKENACLLLGKKVKFKDLNLDELPGKPKIWHGQRILIKDKLNDAAGNVKELLTAENVETVLSKFSHEEVKAEEVALSGSSVKFKKAARIGGWVLQWNDVAKDANKSDDLNKSSSHPNTGGSVADSNKNDWKKGDLTIAKIVSLAAVDAVNPCALAVLTLMLIAILTYNPTDKKKVLFAGLAFTFAVFIIYIFYGLVIIKFFQLIQMLTAIRLTLYKILAVFAVLLGLLNIKDFVAYKPGGFLTEMPLFLRPKVKKLILGITSVKGAFLVGAFVTIFLLPCTIGPYIIAGGMLSVFELFATLPWLVLYNIIFILPMLAITIFVYLGYTTVENVSGWKEKNIRYLHLVAGCILLLLGLAMFFGLV